MTQPKSRRAADLLGRLRSVLGDRYDFEREFGRGGAAIVYLAVDRKHQRRVAIKVLKPVRRPRARTVTDGTSTSSTPAGRQEPTTAASLLGSPTSAGDFS